MRGSRTTLRQVLSLALVAAACSLMLAACGRQAETEAAPPRPVRTTTIEKRETSKPLTFTGRIEAEDEVSVAFRISGRLLANDTKIGDRVEAGQLLARLE
jgi:membrane fusion protein, multidrug efflux system